jgi:hypothetical protein
MRSRTQGFILLYAILVAYTYYTLWLFMTPFLEDEKDHFLLSFFPIPKEYSVLVPVILGLILLLIVGIYATYSIIFN